MAQHSKAVAAALRNLKSVESDILDAGMRLMKSADGQMFIFDHFAIGTLNRAVAISSAFHTLVNDYNMVAAGALVRIHLDTGLRYFASHLVEDWDAFAESVICGKPINKMIDRNGNKLTDFHLSTDFEKKFRERGIYTNALVAMCTSQTFARLACSTAALIAKTALSAYRSVQGIAIFPTTTTLMPATHSPRFLG